MYFITTNQDDGISGVYCDEPGYAPVPQEAHALTESERIMLRNEGAHRCKFIGGALVLNDAVVLTDEKAKRATALDTACQESILAGVVSSALGAPHTYPTKQQDQANLSASVVASLIPNLPSGWVTPHWCMDENGVWAYQLHTVAQIQQAGVDVKAAIVANLTKNAQLHAQIDAATDLAEVKAIVWPE